MSALDKLTLVAPEFAALANVQDWIDLVEPQVAANHCYRELAVAYLAAHHIAISERDGAAGAITSRSEGSLTESYGAVGGVVGMKVLHTTAYGQEYLRLSKQCGNLGGFLMRTF